MYTKEILCGGYAGGQKVQGAPLSIACSLVLLATH